MEIPPPKGIAGLPTRTSQKPQERVIGELFAILDNPDTKPNVREQVNKRIDAFYRSLLKGRRQAINKNKYATYGFQMSKCPQCGKLVVEERRHGKDFEVCRACGWKQKRERD